MERQVDEAEEFFNSILNDFYTPLTNDDNFSLDESLTNENQKTDVSRFKVNDENYNLNIIKNTSKSEKEDVLNEYSQYLSIYYGRIYTSIEDLIFDNFDEDTIIELLDFIDTINYFDKLFASIITPEKKEIVLEYALRKNAKSYGFFDMFKQIPYEYRLKAFKLVSEIEKDISQMIILPDEFKKYLKLYNYEDREDILKNVLLNYFGDYIPKNNSGGIKTRLLEFNITSIIDAFRDEKTTIFKKHEMFDVLKLLLDTINNDHKVDYNIANCSNIIAMFYNEGYDFHEILKFYLDQNKNVDFVPLNLAKDLPIKIIPDALDYIFNYIKENKTSWSIIRLESVLDKLPYEDARDIYIKYVVEEKIYDCTFFLSFCCNYEKYSQLDYIKMIIEKAPEDYKDKYLYSIIDAYSQNSNFDQYNEKYAIIIDYLSEKYNINHNNLNILVKKFGFQIIKQLNNEKIQTLLQVDSDALNKIIDLFNDKKIKYSNSNINDILNSTLQRRFRLENYDIYNIFSFFEDKIFHKDYEGVSKLLHELKNKFDYTDILDKNNCSEEQLLEQIKNNYLDILHEITNEFIKKEREKFVKNNIDQEYSKLDLETIISRESYKEMVIENCFGIISGCRDIPEEKFTLEQKNLLANPRLIDELCRFKRKPKECKLETNQKKYLRTLSEILDIMYNNRVYIDKMQPNSVFLRYSKPVKFEKVQPQINYEYLFDILLDSNINGLLNIVNNPEVYQKLNSYLEKYKFIGWQIAFNKVLSDSDIDFTQSTVAGLISNFDKIFEKTKSNASMTKVLDYANCYGGTSKLYSLLFGREDFNLIATNAGPYKASMPKKDRLNNNKDLLKDMYSRDSITVPPIDNSYEISPGKFINCNIGNITNPINLTYGERTGACMRMGGCFNDLFKYCIQNENGFHVRFTNPNTGKFISRVSGMRNGNTVFLNELRYSIDDNYNNAELYEAIKMVARELVERSKNSDFPIDNVVITPDYALEDYLDDTIDLDIDDYVEDKAYRNIQFSFGSEALLLASSSSEGRLQRYNFSDDVPKYETLRDEVKLYYGNEAINRIKQLKLLNATLNDDNIEDVDVISDINIDYLISGEDFYIAFKDNQMELFVLDSRKDNKKTYAEIEYVTNNLKRYQDEYNKGRNF